MSVAFEQIRASLRQSPARRTAQLLAENRELREAISIRWPETAFVGTSPAAQAVRLAIESSGEVDVAVLISGERGVGKRLVAQLIHRASGRAPGPFIAFSCATMPRKLVGPELFGLDVSSQHESVRLRLGRLELADGGTLFLDEIADMPLDVQPRLLSFFRHDAFQRVGRARRIPVRVRIIASTSHDLRAVTRARLFNRDLYTRLKGHTVRVPPLRERWEDIPSIAEWFLTRLPHPGMRRTTLDDEARKSLLRFPWPGNVRELQDALVRANMIHASGLIRRMDLPPEIADGHDPERGDTLLPPGLPLRDIERLAITRTLAVCHDNRTEAARRLGLSKKGFYLEMKRLGLWNSARIRP